MDMEDEVGARPRPSFGNAMTLARRQSSGQLAGEGGGEPLVAASNETPPALDEPPKKPDSTPTKSNRSMAIEKSAKRLGEKKSKEEKKVIYGAIKANPLFADFSRDERIKMVDSFRLQHAEKGSMVIREGGECDRFYVLERGKVRVVESGVGECSLQAIIAFGEMSLQHCSLCTVSVEAMVDCKMWVLDRDAFRKATELHKAEFLKKVEVEDKALGDILNSSELETVAEVTQIKKFKAGDTVVRKWQKSDSFYVVKEGKVGVFANDEETKPSKTLGSGSFFGEKALKATCVTTATCTAMTDVTCLVLTREDFSSISGDIPDIFGGYNARSRRDVVGNARQEANLRASLKQMSAPEAPNSKSWILGRRGSSSRSPSTASQEGENMILEQKVKLLKQVEINNKVLGDTLKPSELESMATAIETKKFKKGEVIMSQWESGDAFYMIDEGKVDIIISEKGEDPVTTLESGAFFGERAILSTVVTGATCRASTDVMCFVVTREDFMQTMMDHKEIFDKSFADPAEAGQEDDGDANVRHTPRWLVAVAAVSLVSIAVIGVVILI